MVDYALTASHLKYWQERELPDDFSHQIDFWSDLLDTFGPALLPFIIKPDFLHRIPYKILGLEPIDVSGITPSAGESWILFCFRSGMPEKTVSPVRCDGIVLPCEWRRRCDPATGSHSRYLAGSFALLASQVKKQLGCDEWFLFPSFCRFADKIDFTDPDLFASAEHPERIASAWSALATGLYFAKRGSVPEQWPFSSIQFDFASERLLPVEGILEKIAVAADFNCRHFIVAPSQVALARIELQSPLLQSVPSTQKRLSSIKVTAPLVFQDIRVTIEDLATGVVRRKRCRNAIWGAFFLLISLSVMLCVWYYLMWVRPVTEYYATAFRCRDGWEGRGPLSEAVASKRLGNVRFLRHGLRGHVSEVAWMDGIMMPSVACDWRASLDDRLMLESNGDWRVRVVRFLLKREDGRLSREDAYDAFGKKVYWISYNYSESDGVRMGTLYRNNARLYTSAKHHVVQIATTFNQDGLEACTRFLDGQQIPMPAANADGVYGVEVDYYEHLNGDFDVTYTFLSTNGTPAYARDGMAKTMTVFDSQSHLKTLMYLNEQDKLVTCSRGFAAVLYCYDESGNPSSCTMLDARADDAMIPVAFGMASSFIFKYSQGLCCRTTTAGMRQYGRLVPVRCVENELDDFGYVKRCRVLLGPSALVDDPAVFGMAFTRLDQCSIKGYFLDYAGNSYTNMFGAIGVHLTLDEEGRLIARTFIAPDGRPAVGANGVSTIKNTYDGDDLVSVEGVDANNQPAGGEKTPVKIVYRYDEIKNLISTEYLDRHGCPSLFNGKYSKELRRYSRTRKLVDQSFWLPDGSPAAMTNGASRLVTQYDSSLDKPVLISFWWGTNHLINTSQGYASVSNRYDDGGNLIYEAYRDASGCLTNTSSGFAVRIARYNAANLQVELCYRDKDERLVNDLTGRSRYEDIYDFLGDRRGQRAFDAFNQPRLPLVAFKFPDPSNGILPGDILWACDQWRYDRTGLTPVSLALTNGTEMTNIFVARKHAGITTAVRCRGSCIFDRQNFCERYFPLAEEDALYAWMKHDGGKEVR